MLRATELCLICATVVVVAQNKLRVSQLQAFGPRVITENILQAFSSPQLHTSGTADTPCSSLIYPVEGMSVLLQLLYKGFQLHTSSDCGSGHFPVTVYHICPPTLHLWMLKLLRFFLVLLMSRLWHFSGNVGSIRYPQLVATRLILCTMIETVYFWWEDVELQMWHPMGTGAEH